MRTFPRVGQRLGSLLTGWRGLGRFWGTVVVVVAIGVGILQSLGPSSRYIKLPQSMVDQSASSLGPASRSAEHEPPQLGAGRAEPEQKVLEAGHHPVLPGRHTPGPIADPDPALLEPFAIAPNQSLPKIAADGRAPMNAYAAGFDPSSMRPRVGILIAGIGMSEAESLGAINSLPGGVTLAISPYASDLAHLLSLARMTEHEYLLSIPMEPEGYPVNDPDDRYALMTALPPTENLNRLQAVLARETGYVGVTNVLGQMRGERLSNMTDQLDEVLEDVGQRGLLFLDARTGMPALPHAWSRSADVVLDAGQVDAALLDQRLEALTQLAIDKGSALAVVSIPRPVAVERVAAWTNTLAAKGVALAPVSALVQPPAKQDIDK